MNITPFNRPTRNLLVMLVLLYLFFISGCAVGPIKPQSIVPQNFDINKKQPFTVSLHVEGGREYSPLKIPEISNEALHEALIKAINDSGLFNEIIKNEGDYRLELYIFKVSYPFGGQASEVKIEIGWTLRRNDSSKIIWQNTILTTHTTTTIGKIISIDRVKYYIEMAAKKNLKEGIQQISRLDLQQKND